MNVAELARELGVPPSSIIQQCQRFGIDASWAGADLTGADVVVLRAELANEDGLLDLTGHDEDGRGAEAEADVVPADEPTQAHEPVFVPSVPAAEPAALPPTAVGSLPGLADDLATEAARLQARAGDAAPRTAGPGFSAVAAPGAVSSAPVAGERIGPKPPVKRHLDRAVRGGGAALLAAVVLVLAAEVIDNVWVTPFLWLASLGFLAVALLDGNRARRHATLHPERVSGRWWGIAILVLGLAGTGAVGTMVWTVVRTAPADDAPLGVRRLDSVATARWGYQRVRLVVDHGWHSPAKEPGTCWEQDPDRAARQEGRIEVGNRKRACNDEHTVQVLAVYAVAKGTADAPYPSDAVLARNTERCSARAARLTDEDGQPVAAEPALERPTAAGWAASDHDLVCVAVTEPRTGRLQTD